MEPTNNAIGTVSGSNGVVDWETRFELATSTLASRRSLPTSLTKRNIYRTLPLPRVAAVPWYRGGPGGVVDCYLCSLNHVCMLPSPLSKLQTGSVSRNIGTGGPAGLPTRRSRWVGVACRTSDSVGLGHMLISGLNHAARVLAVYASSLLLSGHPLQRKTRYRPGASLGRTGLSPAGSLRKVSTILPTSLPPFPGFAWRTRSRG